MPELGGKLMDDRRRLMTTESEDEDVATKWKEILNAEKTVEEVNTIEFDLSTAEEHDEYVLKLSLTKSTGEETCSGNMNMVLNGMMVGYYAANENYSTNPRYLTYEIKKEVSLMYKTTNSDEPKYNFTNVTRQEYVFDEKGTGKLVLTMPANYSGTVTAVVFAR